MQRARLSWLHALKATGPKMNDPTRKAIGAANSVVVNARIQMGNGLSYSILRADAPRSLEIGTKVFGGKRKFNFFSHLPIAASEHPKQG